MVEVKKKGIRLHLTVTARNRIGKARSNPRRDRLPLTLSKYA